MTEVIDRRWEIIVPLKPGTNPDTVVETCINNCPCVTGGGDCQMEFATVKDNNLFVYLYADGDPWAATAWTIWLYAQEWHNAGTHVQTKLCEYTEADYE